jgi:Ca2+-binding RTX toxin-like protein
MTGLATAGGLRRRAGETCVPGPVAGRAFNQSKLARLPHLGDVPRNDDSEAVVTVVFGRGAGLGRLAAGHKRGVSMVSYLARLDALRIFVNGNEIFADEFNNGTPPPSLTDTHGTITGSYIVLPGSTLSEAGGRVIMDSANSAIRPALPHGDIPHSFQAIVPTNAVPGGSAGLRSDRSFSVAGTYDLVALTDNNTEYGIRFQDTNTVGGVSVGGDDVIAVSVRRGGDGITRVQLSERNFNAGTNDILGSVVLKPPSGADQIVLRLHYDKNTQNVTASFSYVTAGVVGSTINVPGFGKIFGMGTKTIADDENYTRAAFYATGNEDIGAKFLDGDEKANTLNGTSKDDHLVGYGGNDTLNGKGGNDRLVGGTGADTMSGGKGNDTYVVDNSKDKVIELAGEGTDTVNSSISYTLSANVENLTLIGTDKINGTGNGLNNKLTGNNTNNTLNGAGGADTMAGGLGADTYVVDNAGDKVTEKSGQGNDTVRSAITFTLPNHVEHLVLTGTGNINGTGNGLDNKLTGNSGQNTLDGKGGNDTLIGVGGNDKLIGGTGNDRLFGGAGNDTLTGGDGKDAFFFNTALYAKKNVDTITDFSVVDDTIHLDNAIFAKLANGALASQFFVVGTKAKDANDYVIYDKTNGSLLYDADGSGKGAAVKFATLAAGLALTSADFDVL